MDLEQRIARWINVVMTCVLLCAVIGFAAWTFVHDFADVRTIYDGLSPGQQVALSHFGNSALMLSMGVAFAAGMIKRELGRRPKRAEPDSPQSRIGR